MATERTVCVAGLGGIGGSMASRLQDCDWRVVGLDPDQSRRSDWTTDADRQAVDRPEALDWSSISYLVVAVRTEDQVESLLRSCAELASPDLLVLVVSTVPVSFWERARDLVPRSWQLVECPVSGGEQPARQGTVAMFAAGGGLSIARALLDDLSDRIVVFERHGTPALMKLLNNTLAAVNAANLAKCLQLASSQGIDPQAFLDGLAHGSGRSHISMHLDRLSSNQLELLEKDVRLLHEDFPNAPVGRDIAGLASLVQTALGPLAKPDTVL